MMTSQQESASPGPGDPAASFESAKGSNHTAVSLACAILGVCVVYVPWLTIHDMTSDRDVVFSPDLETVPTPNP